MATVNSNTKDSKYFMTWDEVYARVQTRIINGLGADDLCYGVPRGGLIPALLSKHFTDDVREATIIVDDIIATGATRMSWLKKSPTTPFLALVNKQDNSEDARLPWIVFPWELGSEDEGPTQNIIRLLEFIGEDPKREGLLQTPERVLRAFKEMTRGYEMSPSDILSARFATTFDQMEILKGIRFTSLCEHHLLPFSGEVAIGYLPQKSVTGVSKLVRLVECFSQRLQIQEQLTVQIAEALEEELKPRGVGVVIKAHHSCMGCRGVKQPDTEMVTSCLRGVMKQKRSARMEFLNLI